ncbi:hypothetical protein [Clostridium sp. C2-6-12]|nr:hypothetical protein [Clostridium sp. C2-6-12]
MRAIELGCIFTMGIISGCVIVQMIKIWANRNNKKDKLTRE